MRFKKQKGVFLLTLVLSLLVVFPLQVAGLSASVTGQQGVEGYRDVSDVTIVNVTAQQPVKVVSGGEGFQMDCTLRNNIYYCTKTFPQAQLQGGEYTLRFIEGESDQYTTWPFIVDEDAPTIQDFSVEAQPNAELKLTYDVFDSAYYSDSSLCSGIQKITLSSETDQLYEKIIDSSTCLQSDTVTIQANDIVGSVQFYLTVTDNLGHSTTQSSQELEVDFSIPKIQDDAQVFVGDQQLTQVSAIQDVAPSVSVTFSVQEDNLQSVLVDASAMTRNPTIADSYTNISANCRSLGSKNICTISNIQLNPGTGTIPLRVTATDTSANTATKTITTSLSLINKQGVISYFDPNPTNCYQEECYVKPGFNPFLIRIQGADAGITPNLITLATSDVGSISLTKPYTCNETVSGENSVHECKALVLVDAQDIQGSVSRRIVLTRPTTDLIGTPLTGRTSSVFVIDTQPPQLLSSLNYSIANCAIAGETGTFHVKATDDISSQLFISTHIKNISATSQFENRCTNNQDGTFDCSLEINDFVSYPATENVSVMIRDLAGNEVRAPLFDENGQEKVLETCIANADYEPNNIKQITGSTNTKVDRRIASIIPVKVFVSLDIEKGREVTFVDYDTDGCVGTDNLGATPYFINKQTQKPLLVVPLGGGAESVPKDISINCTIHVFQRDGQVRYTLAESEHLQMSVEGFENALGEETKVAKRKLEDVKTEIQELDAKIVKRTKWAKNLQLVCAFDELISRVNQVISTVRSTVYLVAVGTTWFGGAGEALWASTCPVFNMISEFVSYAWPPNLAASVFSGAIGKAENKVSGQTRQAVDNVKENADVDVENLKKTTKDEHFKLGITYLFKMGCMYVECAQCSMQGANQMMSMAVGAIESFSKVNVNKGESSDQTTNDQNQNDENEDDVGEEESSEPPFDAQKEGVEPDDVKIISETEDGVTRTTIVETFYDGSKKTTVETFNPQNLFYPSTSGIVDDVYTSEVFYTEPEPTMEVSYEYHTGNVIYTTINPDGSKVIKVHKKNADGQISLFPIRDPKVVPPPDNPEDSSTQTDTNSNPVAEEQNNYKPYRSMNEKEREQFDREYETKKDQLRNFQKTENNDEEYTELQEEVLAMGALRYDTKREGNWDEFAQQVEQAELAETQFTLDPFKSMGNSQSCGCWIGTIYNFNKLKQLQCRQYSCIKQSIETGFPPISYCEEQFSQGKCLYYDGALSKRHNSKIGAFFSEYWRSIIGNPVNTAFNALCNPASLVPVAGAIPKISDAIEEGVDKLVGSKLLGGATTCTLATGWRDVTCGLRQSAMQIKEIKNIFTNPLKSHELAPPTNFCEGLESELGINGATPLKP